MSWLAPERSELGAERILDAAAQLFAGQGVGRPGMEDIARAAGCSRATVYRYFENKRALLRAFVHREARDVTELVARQLEQGADRREVVVEAVVATLAAVRARPYLEPWYADGATDLLEVFRESPVIAALAGTFVAPRGGEPDADLGRWVLRIVMSFLGDPGKSPDDERRLVERFLAPVIAEREAVGLPLRTSGAAAQAALISLRGSLVAISTLRGFAFSAIGMRRVRTPASYDAVRLSESSVSPRNSWRLKTP
jgi:AcrR family transcriptional regulator